MELRDDLGFVSRGIFHEAIFEPVPSGELTVQVPENEWIVVAIPDLSIEVEID